MIAMGHELRGRARRRMAALRSSEAGMTLVEILVAITIMGIAIPFLIAGLGTASIASDRHRKQTTADTVIKSYGEAIKDTIRKAPATYVDCTLSTSTYSSPSDWSVPAGYSVNVEAIHHRHASEAGWVTNCDPADAARVGTQRLTLRAESTDGRESETLEIVVRKP